ncbi:transcriptional regulator, Crp/Fnr family [Sphingomonas palmae]|uniref:Transcriptional regulator, Crp/Fnr family n=1 Tax=Sphingomonas palmae TaxID=1855283 RepID=A0A1H7RM09_9SPHN|nr:Crp/Fnr family transcriptional regulator [Sphingomonas palmae]SEL61079.1 transcriptional regulator, Crp/Fnr family [Sphingomonas palmae]
MINARRNSEEGSTARSRLSRLAPLDADAVRLLEEAARTSYALRARQELLSAGSSIEAPLILLDGWAARARILPDGRRQIVSLLVPGDVTGVSDLPEPLSSATIVALTPVHVCAAPPRGASAALDLAYAVSRAHDEAFLLAQITRLGRMNAQERIMDLLLELRDRLDLAGLVRDNSFDVPLTQETMSDALGLTPVHVNRMLQAARKAGDLVWTGKRITLSDPARSARELGRVPLRVRAG